ncbi:MAG: PAS domain-containing methyl-accepting chemotaxis protein [Pseudomonadota bacterium]
MFSFDKFGKNSNNSTLKLAALDNSSANFMIADLEYNIVYINSGLAKLLGESENELRRELPNFGVAKLVGSNIDVFYKDTAHQRRVFDALKCSYKENINLGGREFDVIATAILENDSEKRIGTLLEWSDASARLKNLEYQALSQAISRSQAVIEFDLAGTIITANDNFLATLGYSLDEIKGKHHSMFVDPKFVQSSEYKSFWTKLQAGEFQQAEYKRIGKAGKEVWIQASYNPIFDANGKPYKVVKYATDVTLQKLANADFAGQIDAIGKVQAVIQFNLDGTVITANSNFLDALGYSFSEIEGKHHSLFVEPSYAQSSEYRAFWEKLRRGEFDSGVYKRIGKGGKEVWIQASYNPIMDMNGKPFKVVKYATDVTKMITTVDLADETYKNVQSVAAAAEEMTASISEISKNMSLSKQATENIVSRTGASGEATNRLIISTQAMENIVNLIHNIAGQVNLLALNATIEAARAGEAGRGFAVVASEVKNLATQTSKATDDIANEIKSVQSISSEVATSVNSIVEAANAVSQYVNGVASAIEEQTAVTREISYNTQKASVSVGEISERIRSLSK